MNKDDFKEARKSIYILAITIVFVLLFYVIASMFTSVGYKRFRASTADTLIDFSTPRTFIIDAGHGGEDPGAVVNTTHEKDINLSVAFKLKDIFGAFGYKCVLTRDEDKLIYKIGEEKQKKYYDLRNRAEFANKFSDGVFVSIHMNKFPLESCKGLQTFYSNSNSDSKRLADLIQQESKILQTYNNRTTKQGNNDIYLLENIKIPAVLIECGFMSNPEELSRLTNDEYQTALAFSIFYAIAEFNGDI